jgi:6-phosphogluconate dehydrogenase
MQVGMVGLGRMGSNMLLRLHAGGHQCVGLDLSRQNVEQLQAQGVKATTSLDEFVSWLEPPRTAWCMVPHGEATEQTVKSLGECFSAEDIVIDGGNSYFKDDVRRAQQLATAGIHYIDVGTSGGVWGRERGYCLMIGGTKAAVDYLDPVFRCLAPGKGDIATTPGRPENKGSAESGYLHCGPVGAGHFVKMIHNGMEYGMMQAYAEGFDIMKNAAIESLPEDMRYELELGEIAELWRRGSVVSSWLLDLCAISLQQDPLLGGFSGYVQDSGEGRWTVQTAIEEAVPADVLTAALYTRFRSRQEHTFAEKILSAMRSQFGGHTEKTTRAGDA